MSDDLYYRGSSSYEVAVQNKLDALERSGARNAAAMMMGLRNIEYEIRSDIRQSTYAIVASQEMLAETFQHGFNSVNNTLDFGFERVAVGLNNISDEMDELAESINMLSETLCNKLDNMHDIINNPRLTAARELFRHAALNFEKGYFEEALEDCVQAVEKEKTDFISWYLLGQIYLYGAGKFSNVINLQKAEQALENAAKYIDADIDTSSEAKMLASQIYYELGHARLLLSNDLLVEGNKNESLNVMKKAETADAESYRLNKKNLEAAYEQAKALHFIGDEESTLKLLKKIFQKEKSYTLRASCDKSFESIWNKIDKVIENIRDSIAKYVRNELEQLKRSADSGIAANYSDERTQKFKTLKDYIDEILSVIDTKDLYYVTDIQDKKLSELSETIDDYHRLGKEEKEQREKEEAEERRRESIRIQEVERREKRRQEEIEYKEEAMKHYKKRIVIAVILMCAELILALYTSHTILAGILSGVIFFVVGLGASDGLYPELKGLRILYPFLCLICLIIFFMTRHFVLGGLSILNFLFSLLFSFADEKRG